MVRLRVPGTVAAIGCWDWRTAARCRGAESLWSVREGERLPFEGCWTAAVEGHGVWSAGWVPWYREESSGRAVPPWLVSAVWKGSPRSESRIPASSPSSRSAAVDARIRGRRSRRTGPPATSCANRFPDADPEDGAFEDLLGIAPRMSFTGNGPRYSSAAVDSVGQCHSLAAKLRRSTS